MTDRIDLTGIEVCARHGALGFEKTKAQLFRVDVTARLDLSRPSLTDDLSDTLDYAALAAEVVEVVGGESHTLIERVAQTVADAVLAHNMVHSAVVTVHKPHAPVDVPLDDVSVTIERSRPAPSRPAP